MSARSIEVWTAMLGAQADVLVDQGDHLPDRGGGKKRGSDEIQDSCLKAIRSDLRSATASEAGERVRKLKMVDAAPLEVRMIIRVFRARPKRGASADELARLAKEVTIPSLASQPGLVARYTGTGLGATGEEFTVISVWEDLDALKNMTGDDWQSPTWPDPRAKELVAEVFLHHYESIG